MKKSRRDFIKLSAMTTVGTYVGAKGLSANRYGNIIGANDPIRVRIVEL